MAVGQSPEISTDTGAATERSCTLTLVFTDLVSSTASKAEFGEKHALALQEVHRGLVRDAMAQRVGGREIRTIGDGFILGFDTSSEAVALALDAINAHRRCREAEHPNLPKVRIGIHSGEVTVVRGHSDRRSDIYGLHVDIAARVQALAEGDQILMTRGVFDNARARLRGVELPGVGAVQWVRHGFYEFKGLDDPFEICEVGESGVAPLRAPAPVEKAQRLGEEDELSGWRPGLGTVIPGTEWVLEQRLGAGGFGEVWLAHSRSLAARKSVFKFCTSRSKLKSLRRELRILNELTQQSGRSVPGVVQVRSAQLDNPPHYIELEYVRGGDLGRWIERHGAEAPLHIRLDLAVQMAACVASVHEAGFVHRDIKPSNFLLEAEESEVRAPRVRLTDFGVGQTSLSETLVSAHTMESRIHTETLATAAGTFVYTAPELLRSSSSPGRIAERAEQSADIFSLGVTLYQLFTGNIWAVPGPGLRQLNDTVLRSDVAACLDEEPSARPQARELIDLLRRYEERLREQQQIELTKLRRDRRRSRVIIAVVTGALCITIVLFSLFMRESMQRHRVTDLAFQPLRPDTSSNPLEHLSYSIEIGELALAENAHDIARRALAMARTTLGESDPDSEPPEWAQLRARFTAVESELLQAEGSIAGMRGVTVGPE